MLDGHCGMQDRSDPLAHHCSPCLNIILSQLGAATMMPLIAQLDDVVVCEIVRIGSTVEEVVEILAHHSRRIIRKRQLEWLHRGVERRVR